MLETRMPSVSTRTRRLDAPLRPVARPSSAATSALRGRAASRPVFEGNAALETAPERSETRPSPLPRQSRLGRSEMRLMGLATTCTAIVCGLLLLYLAAYAHVSQLGYNQAQARVQLRQNQLTNESLRAERDRLQSRHYVIQQALAQGMAPRGATPIRYITAQTRPGDQSRADVRMAEGSEQDSNSGATADSNQQPSFDH
jgi:cell division protein FtsB